MAKLDDGTEFNVDAATTGFIENLGAVLGMLAHENNWIARDGTVVLPPLLECTKEQITEALMTEIVATSWLRWQRAEQRRRYWGGQFIEIEQGRPLTGMPAEARAYFEYRRSDDDMYDWIANERQKESVMQDFAELRFEAFLERRASGILSSAKLFPEQFVNLQEVNSAGFLSTILGVNIADDSTLYAGMRMVEWIRAYSTLSEIAAERIKNAESPTDRNVIRFKPGELEETLLRLGLSKKASEQFVLNATFAARSDDLFDCPLLRCSDDTALFFAPGSVHADPGMVTYSNLVSLQQKLDSKGKNFEASVMKFFKEKGFTPYSIRADRQGEVFEIDVVLSWDDHIFVFECKNRGLSELHPIQAYYFRKERTAAIAQIKRQVEALLKYPDIFPDACGVHPRGKKIVPCILHALPYSEPGPVDGVFIADWSSVSRFFTNRYLRMKQPLKLFKDSRLLHRSAMYSFWSAERPKPEDFCRQLANPVQIRIIESRMERIESVFIVDEESFGITTEYQRGPTDLKQLGKLLGFDPKALVRTERKVAKIVSAMNKKHERDQLIEQTRRFREQQKRQREKD